MKDPYHNARLRFKVARDRVMQHCLSPTFTLDAAPAAGETKLERYAGGCPQHQREMQRELTPAKVANDPKPKDNDRERHLLGMWEAARILHTMLKFKLTDEREALMLWKLSLD